jgi:hypothetical protein
MSSKGNSKRSAQAPAASDDPSSSSKEARLSPSPPGVLLQSTKNVGRLAPPREEVEVGLGVPVPAGHTRTKWVSPSGPPSAPATNMSPADVPAPQLASPEARSSVHFDDSKVEVMDVEDVAPVSAPTHETSSTAHAPVSQEQPLLRGVDVRRLKSFHVGADKLMCEADIDARSPTHFKVSLAIDPRYPDFTPVDLAAFSIKNSSRALAGFTAAVKLLEAKDQLAMRAPRVPRVLVGLMTEKSTNDLAPSLTVEQQQWLARVGEHMRIHASEILSGQGSERRRFNISNELIECLASAQSLWPSEELTSFWNDLLMQDTTVKRIFQEDDDAGVTSPHDSGTRNSRTQWGRKPKNPHFYMLHLQCAGREVAYIIGCILTRCALLPSQSGMVPLTKQLMQLLDGTTEPLTSVDSTDSEESDPEDPRACHSKWLKVKTKRQTRSVSGYEHRRLVRERLTQGIRTLQRKPEFQQLLSQLGQESERPLLLLSTHISSLRAWVTRYTSVQVDNLHTICDTSAVEILRDNYNFLALSSIPELAPPNAWWKITQTDTGVYTALWMREDMTDVLPKLPELIRQKLGLVSAPPLMFRCTYWQTTRSGKFVPKSAITVSANDNVKITPPSVPSNRPLPALYQVPSDPIAPSVVLPGQRQVSPPPPAGSWAQRVLHAAITEAQKRAAGNPSLNHRPRKGQRTLSQDVASTPTATHRTQPSGGLGVAHSSSSRPTSESASPVLSSASTPRTQHNTQATTPLAASESAAMHALTKSLQEQREAVTALENRVASQRLQVERQLVDMAETFRSRIDGLQQIVVATDNKIGQLEVSNQELKMMLQSLIELVSPTGPLPGRSMVLPPNQLQQQLILQEHAHRLRLPQQQQQRQLHAPSNIRSASAIPARNDSGMVVGDA